MLYYNKLYQSLKKASGDWHAGIAQWFFSWNYFKFYEDGVFITASIASDDTEKIIETFAKGAPNITHGKFTIEGRLLRLSFNDGININAYVNNDRSIVIDGKLGWDVFYPIH